MLEKYFCAPKTLRRLRGGIRGPHVDGFAGVLQRDQYAQTSAVRYIRAAAHLGCFIQRQGGVLAKIDQNTLDSFCRHLRRCGCPHFKGGKISYHSRFGVKLFRRYLVDCGICPSDQPQNAPESPELVIAFRDWFQTHRGVKEPTLRQYVRGATELLQALGEDVRYPATGFLMNRYSVRSPDCRTGHASGHTRPACAPSRLNRQSFLRFAADFPLVATPLLAATRYRVSVFPHPPAFKPHTSAPQNPQAV